MDILLASVFAVIAGAATALSPCALPVLPVVLSAGATGGRRRPLGVAVGLAVSFGVAAVFLTRVIDALGLPDGTARTLAIVVLAAFGVLLLIPSLTARFEAAVSGLVRARPASGGGDGFGSGLVLGASLGLVYAPCAGPILAAVVALNASVSAERVVVGFAYALGAAIALFAVMLLGRRVVGRVRGRLQPAMGVLMVLTALALFAELDTDLQVAIADDLPAVIVNPTGALERSGVVADALEGARGDGPRPLAKLRERSRSAPALKAALENFGPAPEFARPGTWLNSPPLTLAGLRGRVVLIDFWTYTCINCLRTLPYLRAWDSRYRKAGLTIVGVHTPEFAFERETSNVRKAVADNGLRYPVIQDNEYGTWNAWGNQYWPAKYLIDARGRVRYYHFGEGEYEETERAIQTLLAEAGKAHGDGSTVAAAVPGEAAAAGVTTPETYLGHRRAEGFRSGRILPGSQDFGARDVAEELRPDEFAFRGRWQIGAESATALGGARLQAHFGARRVFLVLSSPGRPRRLRVLLDGKPVPAALAGDDVRGSVATIRGQRLYRLVDLGAVKDRVLTLEFEPGLRGYAFTFG